jgi:hypothetical protein
LIKYKNFLGANKMNNNDSNTLLNHLANQANIIHQTTLATEVEKAEYNLFALLKPKFGVDGNQYYVLLGENLQEGVAGFGDTPYKSILDWNAKMNWSK